MAAVAAAEVVAVAPRRLDNARVAARVVDNALRGRGEIRIRRHEAQRQQGTEARGEMADRHAEMSKRSSRTTGS